MRRPRPGGASRSAWPVSSAGDRRAPSASRCTSRRECGRRRRQGVAGPVRPPADVDDAHVRAAELVGQPVGRGEELGPREARHVAPGITPVSYGSWSPLSCPIRTSWQRFAPHCHRCRRDLAERGNLRADAGRDRRRRWPSWRHTSATSAGPSPSTTTSSSSGMDEARAGVAAVLGGDLDEIALTHAATDGDEHRHVVPSTGATATAPSRPATSTPAGSGRCTRCATGRGRSRLRRVRRRTRPTTRSSASSTRRSRRGTRLVSISHVLWTTGLVMPVTRIAALAHERGALVLIDGAQSAGAIPVNVR